MCTSVRTRAELMFGGRCGRPPQGVHFASGRVIVLGEQLDAEQERMLVIPSREGVACAWGLRPDSLVVVDDTNEGEQDTFHQGEYVRSGRWWSDLARGACAHLAEGKRRMPGIDLVICADLPRGEDLGFSAAYLVVLLRSLYEAIGEYRSKWELSDVVPAIRWEWNEVESSPLDPYVVAAAKPGQVLDLDCKELNHEVLEMPEGYELVPEETGFQRQTPSSRYFARQLELAIAGDEARVMRPSLESWQELRPEEFAAMENRLTEPGRRRARHLVTEAQRVRDAVAAIAAGDMETLGRVLIESHRSLTEDWQSPPAGIDELQRAALARPEVVGACVQGLGWGGHLAVLRRKIA